MENSGDLRVNVVVFREDDWWVAQCLEYDIATQTKELTDLSYELNRVLAAQIAVSAELGQEPFSGIGPAPRRYWAMYEAAKMRVEQDDAPFRMPHPIASPTVRPKWKIAERSLS